MHRRRVLQMGMAAAALPVAGCGTTTPDAKTASPDASAATTGTAAGAKPAETSAPAVSSAPDNPPAPPGSAEPAKDPAAGTTPDKPAGGPFSRVIAKVGKNHGHVFEVAYADVVAGAEKTYDLTGSGGHPHAVTLSADDMKTLSKGEILRTKSTKGLTHTHRLLVRCAPAVDPPEWVSVVSAEFSGKDEHEMVIPAADMAAKAARTYDVQGVAGHPHTIEVTAADFEKLAKGEAVSLKTSRDEGDAHLHVVYIQHRPQKKA
jgi:hypothetical protein